MALADADKAWKAASKLTSASFLSFRLKSDWEQAAPLYEKAANSYRVSNISTHDRFADQWTFDFFFTHRNGRDRYRMHKMQNVCHCPYRFITIGSLEQECHLYNVKLIMSSPWLSPSFLSADILLHTITQVALPSFAYSGNCYICQELV